MHVLHQNVWYLKNATACHCCSSPTTQELRDYLPSWTSLMYSCKIVLSIYVGTANAIFCHNLRRHNFDTFNWTVINCGKIWSRFPQLNIFCSNCCSALIILFVFQVFYLQHVLINRSALLLPRCLFTHAILALLPSPQILTHCDKILQTLNLNEVQRYCSAKSLAQTDLYLVHKLSWTVRSHAIPTNVMLSL